MILKVRAFSQDIYSIFFSPYDSNLICTVGMAHIKFWKLAETFTGLKLQGEIGKFGAIEITDIYQGVILQDENVLSTSE